MTPQGAPTRETHFQATTMSAPKRMLGEREVIRNADQQFRHYAHTHTHTNRSRKSMHVCIETKTSKLLSKKEARVCQEAINNDAKQHEK